MIPSWPAVLSSTYSTILVAIGRHRSVRSIGATSPHVGLGAHVLVLPLVGHILTVGRVPCTGRVGRLARLGLLSHIVRFDHTGGSCMYRSHTSVMAHLSLRAVREDHFRKVVAG